MYFLSLYVYKMSLEQAVLDGDIPAVTKLLNTENITQDRITALKNSIEKKKDPNNVFNLLDTTAPDNHKDYVKIDKMLDNYSAVDTVDKLTKSTLYRDIKNTIQSFLGGKKTIKRRVKKSKSKKTKSKKAKRTNKRKPRK